MIPRGPYLGIALLLSACGTIDPIPDEYVQALRPDLYYTFQLPFQTVLANVSFTTLKPAGPTMPLNAQVITWSNEGGNIFDDTLGEALLETFVERDGRYLDWTGVAVAAPEEVFDQVGVELRTFLQVAAYRPPPTTGGFCEADVFGQGITNCGAWIDAILQLWVQCKGDLGQLIPCHGLGYVIAPAIAVFGIAPPQAQGNAVSKQPIPYLYAPNLFLYRAADGWRYKPMQGYATREVLDATPSVGPFATPEEAGRDAALKLDLSQIDWSTHAAGASPPSEELARAARAIHETLHSPDEGATE